MDPYDPQTPVRPDTFAGRERLLAATSGFLEIAAGSRRGTSMLLHGYRGSGKTSALRKIEALARARFPDALIPEIQLRARVSDDMLLRYLVDELLQAAEAKPKIHSRLGKSLARISGVNVLGTGVSLGTAQRTLPTNPFTLWRSALSSLSDISLVVVGIDDAELLAKEGLGTLKAIAEMDSRVPILMVVTGGPEFLENLSKPEYSPIARIFSGAEFDIGQFTVEETRQALVSPLIRVHSKTEWTLPAVERVHRLTYGYPYLVQCVAQASYREGRKIGASDVDAAIPRALSMGANWLARELLEASDEDIRAFIRITSLPSSRFRSQDAVRAGVATQYVSRLTKLGVLHHIARGHYELRKAPAIAYYHALRRGLTPGQSPS